MTGEVHTSTHPADPRRRGARRRVQPLHTQEHAGGDANSVSAGPALRRICLQERRVQDRTDSVNVRWPNTKASEAHIVLEYSPALAFLPAQDPEFWLTAVATIPDETIQLLAEGEATNTLLPGIYPHLYEYVPQECEFTTIDPKFADKALAPDKEKIPHDFGPMDIQALAISEDCHLLVFTALGNAYPES